LPCHGEEVGEMPISTAHQLLLMRGELLYAVLAEERMQIIATFAVQTHEGAVDQE
jgi:hypothetical protein